VMFWSFAILYAADTLNMCLPYKSGTGVTCFEKQFGRQPDVSVLQPFGCRVYVMIEKQKRGGVFADVTVAGIFLGLPWRYGKKGYIVITDDYKRIYISTDVTFRQASKPAKEARNLARTQGADIDDDLLHHLTSIRDVELILQNDPSTDLPQRSPLDDQQMRARAAVRPRYMPDITAIDTDTNTRAPSTASSSSLTLLSSSTQPRPEPALPAEPLLPPDSTT